MLMTSSWPNYILVTRNFFFSLDECSDINGWCSSKHWQRCNAIWRFNNVSLWSRKSSCCQESSTTCKLITRSSIANIILRSSCALKIVHWFDDRFQLVHEIPDYLMSYKRGYSALPPPSNHVFHSNSVFSPLPGIGK